MKKNDKASIEFKDLPEYVQDFLLSDETESVNKTLIKNFDLSAKHVNFLFNILRKIVFKEIEIGQLLEELKILELTEEQTKKIAVEILKKRVLPLSDYLKVNTLSYIKEWGGDIPVDELSELVKTESQGKIDADSVVNQIIKETGLELPDDIIKNRLKNIVLSFIRDVRSSTEMAIILKRPLKIGGVGLEQVMVDKIMEILHKQDQQIQDNSLPTKKIVSTEKAKALMKSSAQKLLKAETKVLKLITEKNDPILLPEKKEQQLLEEEENIEAEEDIDAKQEEIVQGVEEVIKKFQPQRVSPLPVSSVESQPIKNTPVLSRKLEESDKTMVEGISNRPKIYGPSDELRSISLVDWRRWGTSQEAILKIQGKINLLAEDSLVKKSEGIKAWKESEINKLYIEIGEDSINNGRSIEETINQRQKQGQKTLNQEEFNAVVELNQKLRF